MTRKRLIYLRPDSLVPIASLQDKHRCRQHLYGRHCCRADAVEKKYHFGKILTLVSEDEQVLVFWKSRRVEIRPDGLMGKKINTKKIKKSKGGNYESNRNHWPNTKATLRGNDKDDAQIFSENMGKVSSDSKRGDLFRCHYMMRSNDGNEE